nr:MAG TPA: hypothetical protein [Caudoviricetes sp.]
MFCISVLVLCKINSNFIQKVLRTYSRFLYVETTKTKIIPTG